MSNKLTVSVEQVSEEIRGLLLNGITAFRQAAEVYANYIVAFPDKTEKLHECLPEIPPRIWKKLDLIGRGAMTPLLGFSVKNETYIEGLTVPEQERILNEAVEVYLPDNRDGHIRVELKNMTSQQCRQVFARDHVRTIQEQRALLETEKTARYVVRIHTTHRGYSIRGGYIVISEPCKISREELKAILKKLGA
jgi:muconolactone delta-isomerase